MNDWKDSRMNENVKELIGLDGEKRKVILNG